MITKQRKRNQTKLSNYNYENMTLSQIKELGKYFVDQIHKIKQVAPGVVPEIDNLFSQQSVQYSTNTSRVNYPTDNYLVSNNLNRLPLYSSSVPEYIDMPTSFGGMSPKIETIQPTPIEDNSPQLTQEIQTLLTTILPSG